MPPALDTSDLHRLLELVGEVGDAEDRAAFRAAVLPALRRTFPCTLATYAEVDPLARSVVTITDPEVTPEGHAAFARHAHEHPLIVYHQRTQDGRARRISDFWPSREAYHASPLYRGAFRELGIEFQMSTTLPSAPPLIIGIALSRSGPPDFGDAEILMYDLARPHLVQAFRNASLRERATRVIEALGAGTLDDGAAREPIVLVEDGAVLFASSSASALLEHPPYGPVVEGERLPPPLSSWMADGDGAPLVVQTAEGDVVLRCLRSRSGGPDALVVGSGRTGMPAAALEGMGLTRREAEVLRWVALGRDNADIARRLGISRRTVHKHMEHVYAKLGVATRSQAAATAWAAVAPAPEEPVSADVAPA